MKISLLLASLLAALDLTAQQPVGPPTFPFVPLTVLYGSGAPTTSPGVFPFAQYLDITIGAQYYWNGTTWVAISSSNSSTNGGTLTGLNGDVSASGVGNVTATLATVATPGTSTKVTYDAKGRITSGTTLSAGDIPSLAASAITSGTFAIGRLATGTPDGTKFVRDDGTLVTPAGGSQTPWTGDIAAAFHSLTAAATLVSSNSIATNSGSFGTNGVAPSGIALNSDGSLRVTGTASVTNALIVQGNSTLNQNLNVGGTITGNGSGVTALNGSSISSGSINTARLSGDANSAHYLDGTGAYTTPAGGSGPSAGTNISVSGTAVSVQRDITNLLSVAAVNLYSGGIQVTGAGPTDIYGSVGKTNYMDVGPLGVLFSNVFGILINNKGMYWSNNSAAVALTYDATAGTLTTVGGFVGPASGLTSLAANQLSSGTVPDARFPATLPALSGVNLTALNASQLASGSVPAGRFAASTISESILSLSDVTTANASTSQHGFLPKLDGNAAHYVDGTGAYTTPAGNATLTPSTITQTNFVLNTVYNNGSGAINVLKASVAVTTAAVSGDASLDLMCDQSGGSAYALLSRVGIGTTVGVTLAMTYTNTLSGSVSNGANYYFTNSSTGAGNSSSIVPFTGQITVIGAGSFAGITNNASYPFTNNNNIIGGGSNFFGVIALGGGFLTATNLISPSVAVIDFSKPGGLLVTNNVPNITGFINKEATGKFDNGFLLKLTNSAGLGTAFQTNVAWPVGTRVIGNSVITNWKEFWVEFVQPSGPTNAWDLGGW